MKLLLATNHLGLGGSESYLLTVAEQFDRLGHEVVIYTPEPGAGLPVALERGLAVVDEAGLAHVGGDCDGVLVQDPGVCFQIADLYPDVPRVFVAHTEIFDLQAPPQLDGAVNAVVALNDRIAERLRHYAVQPELVRLRQPIDTERFVPRNPLPEIPRAVLFFSSTPSADRWSVLEAAVANAGLELSRLGGSAGQAPDPRTALAEAHVVIGYGRSILEAMACGRAAYVYDWSGGDGWVTAESYQAIEADGFAGRSGRTVVDEARLCEDLKQYRASMGPVNRDLVIAHHRATAHVQQLLDLFDRLTSPSPLTRAPLQEMARLVRLEWRARGDAHFLGGENAQLREQLRASDEAYQEVLRDSEAMKRDAARQIDEAKATAAAEMAETRRTFEESRSWRLTAPMRAVARLLHWIRRR